VERGNIYLTSFAVLHEMLHGVILIWSWTLFSLLIFYFYWHAFHFDTLLLALLISLHGPSFIFVTVTLALYKY